LDDDDFSLLEKRQKNVYVFVGIGQVADIDAGGTGLRGVVPQNIAIARIPRRRNRVRHIKEQA
jgi:hypothetical protein